MTDLDAQRRRLADRGYVLVSHDDPGLDPDPLYVDPDDENPPAVFAWGCLAAIGWIVVILVIAASLPVAGSVTESRVASVAVSPSEGSSWSVPATRIGTVIIEGKASWMPAKYGASYLAMRIPRGTRVTLCGDGGCWTTRVNDYGPSKRLHPDRIADIAVGQWERLCGLDRSAGLCRITAEYGGKVREQKPNPTAPATDVGS